MTKCIEGRFGAVPARKLPVGCFWWLDSLTIGVEHLGLMELTPELARAILSFIAGVLVALFASWLAARRWAKTVAHDGSRQHLVWRYQKQLSCYREFFDLWGELTTESDYVLRIEEKYEDLADRQQSAGRHARRRAAPLLAEFGFVFGGTLTDQAASLLEQVASSRLGREDAPNSRTSLNPPDKDELDYMLEKFQKGIIAAITTIEELLELPPRLAVDSIPTVAVGKGFTFAIVHEKKLSVPPGPVRVPRQSAPVKRFSR